MAGVLPRLFALLLCFGCRLCAAAGGFPPVANRLVPAIVAAALVRGGGAQGAQEEEEEEEDTAESGGTAHDESEPNLKEIMEMLDTDKDGLLNQEDFMGGPDAEASEVTEEDRNELQRAFTKADANGDGKIDIEELPTLLNDFEGRDERGEL
uniref:EF-hand domain-containing protein n=1 Tax=Pyrodinium bahamense TaxID=73915 RepID=A0A7S0A159_9DINO